MESIRVDIIFDPVCPWCYIGKRRLEQAFALRPNIKVIPTWRPFLLNPEMPASGIDRTAYLIKKFGGEARVSRAFGAIAEAGQSVEIGFAFDKIRRTPNTVNAHRLVRFAAPSGKAGDAVEALFHDYFVNGNDIGQIDALVALGGGLGFVAAALRGYLKSDEDMDFIYEENARVHRLGINGVPAFVFNDGLAISGAQEPRVLARILDAAKETENAA
ncbi:MAG TPA: DsbA family oxidoreductase [Rhodospirillales bacterium]|jgi:predicted DsbA family dithiol-disulfide isomerase|nr:DsbA family oxidoreductase [Rhodospirillales bacterium]